MTLFSSLKSLTFRLWDEQAKRLVGYGRVRQLRRQQRQVRRQQREFAARHEPP